MNNTPPNFWQRLHTFIEDVSCNDPMSYEEKEMILHVCRQHIKEVECKHELLYPIGHRYNPCKKCGKLFNQHTVTKID